MSQRELTQRIKQHALELGFDLVGVAPAEGSPELAFYEKWLAAGYAGDMHYLSRTQERRSDLQKVLPGARSVVVCGLNYDTPYPYSTDHDDPQRGWVARYAWGEDYHGVLADKLERLRDFTAALLPPADSKLYVDTGPVVERVYAKYARPRLVRQEHLPARQASRLLAPPRRPRADGAAGPRQPDTRPLRHLHALPGCLSHRGVPRTVRPRRAALHLLPDDRAQDRDSRGPARADGQPRSGLRHLPGRLPVESQTPLHRRTRPASPSGARASRP